MAKQNRKLEPTVILCFNLVCPEEEADAAHIKEKFNSLIDTVLEGIPDVKENIIKAKNGLITIPFSADEIVFGLVKAINVALEIHVLWLNSSVNLSRKKRQEKLINLAIAIHQVAFPGGKPGGFGLECGAALWNLAQKEAEQDKSSKIFLSRDGYDVLEAANRLDSELNFTNLGLQKFENIPPMTVYEINKKGEQDGKEEELIKTFLEGVPCIQGFVGRETELEKLQALLKTNNTAMVCGLPGIGKTALCSNLALLIQNTYKVFWITLYEDITEEIILIQLSAFLAEAGDKTFKRAQNLNLDEKIQALINSLEKQKYALFFDLEGYTIKDDQIKTILSALDKGLKESVGIFIVPRRVEFLERSSLEPVMLGELNREEIIQFLKVKEQEDLSERGREEIIEKIGGNPYVLKHFIGLIQRYWYDPEELVGQLPRYREETEKYLIERLFSESSLEEKNLLFLLSLLRKPTDNMMAKEIYRLADFEEKINSILGFFVFTIYPDNRYIAHSITRRIALSQERDAKRIHQQIGDCFNNLLNTKNADKDIYSYLEAHYHYFECGRTNESFEIIFNNLETLLKSGYPKTIEQLFNKYTPSILKPENWVNLWQCKGIIAESLSDFDRAQGFYQEMLQYAEKIMFYTGQIRSLMLLAKNLFSKEKATEAIEFLNKACQLSERIEDKDLMAEVYQRLAEYCLDAGDNQKSKEWTDRYEQLLLKNIETGKEWIY